MDDAARVLVIEDEQAIRDAVVVALRAGGYAVDAAADGDRAVATLQTFRPDLEIVDVMLPTTDGFTLGGPCIASPICRSSSSPRATGLVIG
jgi:DNA-binding response OmpR family regulator